MITPRLKRQLNAEISSEYNIKKQIYTTSSSKYARNARAGETNSWSDYDKSLWWLITSYNSFAPTSDKTKRKAHIKRKSSNMKKLLLFLPDIETLIILNTVQDKYNCNTT